MKAFFLPSRLLLYCNKLFLHFCHSLFRLQAWFVLSLLLTCPHLFLHHFNGLSPWYLPVLSKILLFPSSLHVYVRCC